MITAKKFYMIRHGESIANRDGYFSGNMDVELTDLGKEQAQQAITPVEALQPKPVQIIHSHLERARHTAEIINHNLQLPMYETSLLGEHHLGDWHGEPWDIIRPRFFSGENPPGGETHNEFAVRIRDGINWALEKDGPVLIVCHGGVFRGFYRLYNAECDIIENCVLYEFTPDNSTPDFPWKVKAMDH